MGLNFHSCGKLFFSLALSFVWKQQSAFDGQLVSQLSAFPLLLPSTFSADMKQWILDEGYGDNTAASGAISEGEAELWWPPGAQELPDKMQEGAAWMLDFAFLL